MWNTCNPQWVIDLFVLPYDINIRVITKSHLIFRVLQVDPCSVQYFLKNDYELFFYKVLYNSMNSIEARIYVIHGAVVHPIIFTILLYWISLLITIVSKLPSNDWIIIFLGLCLILLSKQIMYEVCTLQFF